MKTASIIAALLVSVLSNFGGQINVTYSYTDFQLNAATNGSVTLYPLSTGISGNYIVTDSAVTLVATNGSVTFSNVLAGYAYRATFRNFNSTILKHITNSFPSSLSGNVNASDWVFYTFIVNGTNASSTTSGGTTNGGGVLSGFLTNAVFSAGGTNAILAIAPSTNGFAGLAAITNIAQTADTVTSNGIISRIATSNFLNTASGAVTNGATNVNFKSFSGPTDVGIDNKVLPFFGHLKLMGDNDLPEIYCGVSNLVMMAQDNHIANQNILYIGSDISGRGTTFDCVTLQANNTNAGWNGQFDGTDGVAASFVSPRHTLMFKYPQALGQTGSYSHGWRFEPFKMTLQTPYNNGIAQAYYSRANYQVILRHNNTNWIRYAAEPVMTNNTTVLTWWTNQYGASNSVNIIGDPAGTNIYCGTIPGTNVSEKPYLFSYKTAAEIYNGNAYKNVTNYASATASGFTYSITEGAFTNTLAGYYKIDVSFYCSGDPLIGSYMIVTTNGTAAGTSTYNDNSTATSQPMKEFHGLNEIFYLPASTKITVREKDDGGGSGNAISGTLTIQKL